MLRYMVFIAIIMKLVGAIDWSWWVVLAPLWIPVAFGLALGALGQLSKDSL